MTYFLRLFTLLFATLVIVGCGGNEIPPGCEIEDDESERKLSCISEKATVEEQPTNEIEEVTISIISMEEGRGLLTLQTKSNYWNFRGIEEIRALVDEDRRVFRVLKHTPSTQSGNVREMVHGQLSSGDMGAIAEAESFRVQLGGALFNLSRLRQQFRAVRQFEP